MVLTKDELPPMMSPINSCNWHAHARANTNKIQWLINFMPLQICLLPIESRVQKLSNSKRSSGVVKQTSCNALSVFKNVWFSEELADKRQLLTPLTQNGSFTTSNGSCSSQDGDICSWVYAAIAWAALTYLGECLSATKEGSVSQQSRNSFSTSHFFYPVKYCRWDWCIKIFSLTFPSSKSYWSNQFFTELINLYFCVWQ